MTADDWWRRPLGELVAGRRVILAGGVAAGWTTNVPVLRVLGARDVLVVATDGRGAGPQPDASCISVEPQVAEDAGVMARIRAGLAALAGPPAEIIDAVESFDPEGTALVFGIFLVETPSLYGRPFVAHRRPEWVALEDKTRIDDVLDRAGVPRAPSTVVPVGDAVHGWRHFDAGTGTVWAADATNGYHGGGSLTRWVADDDDARRVSAELAPHCAQVRIMPFLDGIATSVHGIVLPDGVAALRPVELVTLRQGRGFRYAGCATFWDPPDALREEMRAAARRVGETLRADVDFRGAFTLDGVATAEGFRPTELNPRFGAGLAVITRGLGDLPLHLLLDLVVAGLPLGIGARELEQLVLTEADAHRSGGTWQLSVDVSVEITGRPASYVGGMWRWADTGATDEHGATGEEGATGTDSGNGGSERGDGGGETDEDGGEHGDGTVVAAGSFARAVFDPERTPVGPSVDERAVAFWRFMDAEVGTNVGPLTAPPDLTAGACPILSTVRVRKPH